MTTGIDPEPGDWRRRWAADQLDVGANAPPSEVRAALLHMLPDADFVPPDSWRRAWEVLTGQAGEMCPADEEARLEEEDRLRDEVESFAEGYWGLAPAERRRRWEALTVACDFSPPLVARLHALEAGLDVEEMPAGLGQEKPQVVRLAETVRALFVRRPAARAAARRAFLQEVRQDEASWGRAARLLRRRYGGLAGLHPELLTELADWKAWSKQVRRGCGQSLRAERAAARRGNSRRAIPSWVAVLVGAAVAASGLLRDSGTKSPAPTMPLPRMPSPQQWERLQQQQELEKLQQQLRNLPESGLPPFQGQPEQTLPRNRKAMQQPGPAKEPTDRGSAPPPDRPGRNPAHAPRDTAPGPSPPPAPTRAP